MSDPTISASYYAKEAYSTNEIPQQDDASPRGIFHKLVGTRLPWGNTQEAIPESILKRATPKSMRFWEEWRAEKAEMKANGTYVPRPFEHLDLHVKHDHEVIRHAQFPFSSQFWLFLKTGGKWITILFTPIVIMAHLTVISTVNTPHGILR